MNPHKRINQLVRAERIANYCQREGITLELALVAAPIVQRAIGMNARAPKPSEETWSEALRMLKDRGL